jgi:hypothetical protein
MRLTAQLVDVADVTQPQRDEMFALMDDHYANVHRHVFEADLAEKRWVILIRDLASDGLRGFSTQTLLDAKVGGRLVKALFSGDTIIHRECWGDQALAHVWGRFALALIDAHAGEELHDFYPRHDRQTPIPVRAIIDTLAWGRYPEAYDAASGVIRAAPLQYRLRSGLADVTPERLRDPHVCFFQARNPGHSDGDELCCLAPLTRANFTRAAYRVIGPEPTALGVS